MKHPNGELIRVAARLARCDALSELDELCDTQKTVSTARVRLMLDRAENELKLQAVHIKNAIPHLNG